MSATLLEMFQYGFFRRALLAILLIAPLLGALGCLVLETRMTFFSDAVGHAGLSGIAIGTLLGFSDPLVGLTGFSVSNLRIPGFAQPWEQDHGKPGRIASALDVMIAGPLGGAAFNNEFGRPNICGYFRTFEQPEPAGTGLRGYHKPIMLAGGMGNIRPSQLGKNAVLPGAGFGD